MKLKKKLKKVWESAIVRLILACILAGVLITFVLATFTEIKFTVQTIIACSIIYYLVAFELPAITKRFRG